MENYFRRNRNTMSLSPSEIRFTQDSVAMCFQNGSELSTTCEDIAKGNVQVESFPTIRVGLHEDGNYYSVDNRRLYIFRVLNLLGVLSQITCKTINYFDREFTTENDGCHVRIRNRKDNNERWQRPVIFRHCACQYERNKKLPDWWNLRWKCHVDLVKAARLKEAERLRSQNLAGRDNITRRELTVTPKPYNHPVKTTVTEENNISISRHSTNRASSRSSQRRPVIDEDLEPFYSRPIPKNTLPEELHNSKPVVRSSNRSINSSIHRFPQPWQPPVVTRSPSPVLSASPRRESGRLSATATQSNQARVQQYNSTPTEPEESCITQLIGFLCCCFKS